MCAACLNLDYTLQLPQWRGERPHLLPGCLLSQSCRPAAEAAPRIQLCSAVTQADIWQRPQCSISEERSPLDGSLLWSDIQVRLTNAGAAGPCSRLMCQL